MAIVIGDIHGNFEKVKTFLAYKPEAEHIALGDYVDSFTEPVNRQVEALQMLLDSDAVLLWGNHDLHYLKIPPFICTGYQHKNEQVFREMIETNKRRFLAAYVADGWLCTHAGVHIRLAKRENESTIADRLNKKMAEYLDKPHEPGPQSIFAIGQGRGGESRCGGIFWFDFKRENGLDLAIKQIFGHTETREPVVTGSYVALDTTNCGDTCYLYDTEANEIVKLKLPLRAIRADIDWGDEDIVTAEHATQEMIEENRAGLQDDLYWGFADSVQFVVVRAKTAKEAMHIASSYWQMAQTIMPTGVLPLNAREISYRINYKFDKIIWETGPGSNEYFYDDMHKEKVESFEPNYRDPRLRDLPEEEREPFWQWLMGQTRPGVEGLPVEDQDFFYEHDYRRWKAGLQDYDHFTRAISIVCLLKSCVKKLKCSRAWLSGWKMPTL